MFMDEIDWNDPKFARWHLGNLSPLTKAQREAVWEDDVRLIIFPFASKKKKLIQNAYITGN